LARRDARGDEAEIERKAGLVIWSDQGRFGGSGPVGGWQVGNASLENSVESVWLPLVDR
jgi:hypothetical protein